MRGIQIVSVILLLVVSIARLFVPGSDAFGDTTFWLFDQIDIVTEIVEAYGGFDISMIFDMGPYFIFLLMDSLKVILYLLLLIVTLADSNAKIKMSKIALSVSLLEFVFMPAVRYDFGGGTVDITLTTIALFLPVLLHSLFIAFDPDGVAAKPSIVMGVISFNLVAIAYWLAFGVFSILYNVILLTIWDTIVVIVLSFIMLKYILYVYQNIIKNVKHNANAAGIICVVIPVVMYGLVILNYEGLMGICQYVDLERGNLQLTIPIIVLALLVINTMITIIRKKSKF